ncbi:MAG TPA: hypothetical protein VHE37_07170 [Nevskiaceae bacterium]|nr:hypothetical protein [Nevskiaceae bacterium]
MRGNILLRPSNLLLLCGLILLALTAMLSACGAPAALCLGCAAFAHAGEQLPGSETNLRYTACLLVASATLRLFGQVLRMPALSATPRMLEAYALRTLAGLHQLQPQAPRRWGGAIYCGSLALERASQRLTGAALQQLLGLHI